MACFSASRTSRRGYLLFLLCARQPPRLMISFFLFFLSRAGVGMYYFYTRGSRPDCYNGEFAYGRSCRKCSDWECPIGQVLLLSNALLLSYLTVVPQVQPLGDSSYLTPIGQVLLLSNAFLLSNRSTARDARRTRTRTASCAPTPPPTRLTVPTPT